jgi:hypothetical protein
MNSIFLLVKTQKLYSAISGRVLASLLILLTLQSVAVAQNSNSTICIKMALKKLKQSDPVGFKNYVEIKNKNDFTQYINDCSDNVLVHIGTAVHESTHIIDLTTGTFSTVTGVRLPVPRGDGYFFPPSKITKGLDLTDIYVRTYLLGDSSSKDDYLVLLDELNAYTRSLSTSIKLIELLPRGTSTSDRDGLAAIMLFVKLYAFRAQNDEIRTWDQLKRSEVSQTIKMLWIQAEATLDRGCLMPALGISDKKYLRQIYDHKIDSTSISFLLGHPLKAPSNCHF